MTDTEKNAVLNILLQDEKQRKEKIRKFYNANKDNNIIDDKFLYSYASGKKKVINSDSNKYKSALKKVYAELKPLVDNKWKLNRKIKKHRTKFAEVFGLKNSKILTNGNWIECNVNGFKGTEFRTSLNLNYDTLGEDWATIISSITKKDKDIQFASKMDWGIDCERHDKMVIYFKGKDAKTIFESINEFKRNNPNHFNTKESCSDFLFEVAPGIGVGIEKEEERMSSYSDTIVNLLRENFLEWNKGVTKEFIYKGSAINKNNMTLPGWFRKMNGLELALEVYGTAIKTIRNTTLKEVGNTSQDYYEAFKNNQLVEDKPKQTQCIFKEQIPSTLNKTKNTHKHM